MEMIKHKDSSSEDKSQGKKRPALDGQEKAQRDKKKHDVSKVNEGQLWFTNVLEAESDHDIREAISNQNDVSMILAKHIVTTTSNGGNVIFSPLSILSSLNLIAAGSAGQTRAQLLSFLKSESIDTLNNLSQKVANILADGSAAWGPLLSFANGVWVDQSLTMKSSFKNVVEDVHKAACHEVDFQNNPVLVTKEVNLWAEEGTKGLIKEILPADSVDTNTRLIFANALYFKGSWTEKFDVSKTRKHMFHLLNGRSIFTPFMTNKEEQYVRVCDDFKVLGLPYVQGYDEREFFMYIFLPNQNDGLFSLLEKLCSEPGFVERHLPRTKWELSRFWIPKFRMSFGFEASKLLKSLGMVLPFSPGGLTEIVESEEVGRKLYVSNIFHKSFVEVNEEGTEAAAATAWTCQLQSFTISPRIDFVADHPFVFLIRENKTGLVTFMGCLLDPTLS